MDGLPPNPFMCADCLPDFSDEEEEQVRAVMVTVGIDGHLTAPGTVLDGVSSDWLPLVTRRVALVAKMPGIWGARITMEGLGTGHRPAPYSPEPLSDVWRLCLYHTTTDQSRVNLYGPDNDLIDSVSFPAVARPMDDAAREFFLQRLGW